MNAATQNLKDRDHEMRKVFYISKEIWRQSFVGFKIS